MRERIKGKSLIARDEGDDRHIGGVQIARLMSDNKSALPL
jgi:hypothetical protein